nr:PREDICTED: probable oligoribonuclease [Megachile rotundata]
MMMYYRGRTIFTHALKQLNNYFQLTTSRHFQNPNVTVLSANKNVCNNRIVWLDMEMTGLDINTDYILEIACLITDKNLQVISKDLNIVVHQPDEILNNMNDWCLQTHKKD